MTLGKLIRSALRVAGVAGASAQASPTYGSFEEALSACGTGYSDDELARVILEKTKAALLDPPALKWEQGAGLFMAIPYAALVAKTRSLRVLDYGGSYGLHGAIAQANFPELDIKWAIVETPTIAAHASQIEIRERRIFDTIDAAVDWLGGVDLLHSSGTLQYSSDPDTMLKQLVAVGAPVMLWQRLVLQPARNRRVIEIQRSRLRDNGPGPLPAGFSDREVLYPRTLLSETEFLAACSSHYALKIKVAGERSVSEAGIPATFNDVFLFCAKTLSTGA